MRTLPVNAVNNVCEASNVSKVHIGGTPVVGVASTASTVRDGGTPFVECPISVNPTAAVLDLAPAERFEGHKPDLTVGTGPVPQEKLVEHLAIVASEAERLSHELQSTLASVTQFLIQQQHIGHQLKLGGNTELLSADHQDPKAVDNKLNQADLAVDSELQSNALACTASGLSDPNAIHALPFQSPRRKKARTECFSVVKETNPALTLKKVQLTLPPLQPKKAPLQITIAD